MLMGSSYLLPTILLNPAVVLHFINTIVSYFSPAPSIDTVSSHQFLESLGPRRGSKLFMDVHANDRMCWQYTIIMVVIQLFVYGQISANRMREKSAKAEILLREENEMQRLNEMRNERIELVGVDSHASLDGICEVPEQDVVFANETRIIMDIREWRVMPQNANMGDPVWEPLFI